MDPVGNWLMTSYADAPVWAWMIMAILIIQLIKAIF
jgi:hypothetical protein